MPTAPRPLVRSLALAAVLSVALAAAGCEGDEPLAPEPEPAAASILDAVRASPRLTTFERALDAARLASGLATGGPYTVFAPDEEAFYNLGPESAASLLDPANADLLTLILRRHVVPGAVDEAALTDGARLVTLGGDTLAVRVVEGRTYVGEAALNGLRIEAANGVVLGVTTALREHLTLGQRLRLIPIAADIRAALDRAGYGDDLLRPDAALTLLVPLDNGFETELGGPSLLLAPANADLLARTAGAHVLPGARPLADLLAAGAVGTSAALTLTARTERDLPFLDGSRVLFADVRAANGVLHLLDRPLLEHLTIGQRLRLMPSAQRLLQAYARGGATAWLDEPGPYTLFAFTNEGFDALGQRVSGALLRGERPEILTALLGFHLALGLHPTTDLTAGQSLPTRSGREITVQGPTLVGRRQLGRPRDVVARNGLLHVVDGVLIPQFPVVDLIFLRGLEDYLRLLEETGYDDSLRTGGPFTVVAPDNTGRLLNPAYACVREAAVRSSIARGLFYPPAVGEPVALPTLGPPGHTLLSEVSGRDVAFFVENAEGRERVELVQGEDGLLYPHAEILFRVPTANPPCP